jgi:hypothetical protein
MGLRRFAWLLFFFNLMLIAALHIEHKPCDCTAEACQKLDSPVK